MFRISCTTLADHVDRAADRWQHDVLVMPGSRYGFGDFAEATLRMARRLRGLGVAPAAKVGILMENRPEFLEVLIGAARLGAVPVPINSRYRTVELRHVLANADVEVLVTSTSSEADYADRLVQAFPELRDASPGRLRIPSAPELRHVVALGHTAGGGLLSEEDLADAGSAVRDDEIRELQQRVRIRDTAVIMYTSGTTAAPKGCMLSHEALVRTAFGMAETRYDLTPDDRVWDPLPFFHLSSLLPFLGCLAAGSTFVGMRHFDAGLALQQLEEERCTVAYPSFETIWLPVLDHPRFASTDLSSIRLVNNVSPVPAALDAMHKRLPHARQIAAYGATEGAGVIAWNAREDPPDKCYATSGQPLPGIEVRVVDHGTGRNLPPGELGEIRYRGYCLFDGYYKDPELTSAAIDDEGWFHSGDLGMLDEDGRICYRGRLKDMLKVGGENVAATEVEAFLTGHPAINIVQVVGAPDPRYAEVPAAFIETKPGYEVTEGEIVEFCRGQIASFKVPRYVRFVSEWPMSGTKIQKHRLRERIAAELRGAMDEHAQGGS